MPGWQEKAAGYPDANCPSQMPVRKLSIASFVSIILYFVFPFNPFFFSFE
jgi:hypothetical protein